MGLGVVVDSIVESGGPGDCVFAVAGAILNPVESLVHSFGALKVDGVVGEARCYGIVSDDGCRCVG